MEKEEKKPKKIKLTRKQRGFVNDYVKTENGTYAAMNNYNIGGKHGTKNPEVVAANIATENLSKPYITEAIDVKRQSLKSALIQEGIDEKKIAQKVSELLHAKTSQLEPDYNAIDKGLKHATNIYGVEDLEKPKGNTYNFILNAQFQERIKPLEEAYKEQFKNVKPPKENS